MAARALQPLVQKGQLNSVMNQLLGMIPVDPTHAKHSHVHGALIQVGEKKIQNQIRMIRKRQWSTSFCGVVLIEILGLFTDFKYARSDTYHGR